MKPGTRVGRFTIGLQIGQGAFGKIYAAKDTSTGLLYAIKNESATAERKTLAFETKILERIQKSPYFPKLFDTGETESANWVAMELVGPSLLLITKKLNNHRLTISTALRTAKHTLLAIEDLHRLGFIHRDIKPGNILVRLSNTHDQPPICVIDFGLVRIYRDQMTMEHEKPRQRTGFRGTKTYASLNAHALNDLSRRDDLVSWFYFMLDIATEGLPWKGLKNGQDVLTMKKKFDMAEALHPISPKLMEIWEYVLSLKFEDEPDYRKIESKLVEVMDELGIKETDPWDWMNIIEQYKGTLSDEFGVPLRIDGCGEILPYYTELGVPPVIYQQMDGRRDPLRSPLLGKHRGKNYSVMQLSELNEKDEGCCC